MSTKNFAFEFEGADHQACTAELLAVVAELAIDRHPPPGVSFEITCLDSDSPLVEAGYPPRPHWFIRGPGFHDARISNDDVMSVVEDLVPTMDVVTAIIEEALSQVTTMGIPSLTELRWEGHHEIELCATNRFGVVTLELSNKDPSANDEFLASLVLVESRPGWSKA